MTSDKQNLRPGEEEALESLLREMEPTAEPPPAARERIRQAAHAEWRAVVTEVATARSQQPAATPRRAWQRPALALAASLAVATVALGVMQLREPATPVVVAKLVRISGAVEASGTGALQPAVAGQSLLAGQTLVTGPDGKLALALAQGVTLRLATDTRVDVQGIDRLYVERGAVYLDAGPTPARGASVRIDSAFGSTRHLGTQYEVRVNPDLMQVSVREGQVEWTGADPSLTAPATTARARHAVVLAQAGEQISVSPAGAVERSVIARRDPRWDWISEVTPPFAIEDRKLTDFLAWVCRETGRDLAFASPQVEATAKSIVLRGSVAGLSPDDALSAVMATTNLAYSDDNGRLTIRPPIRQAATR